ncbi:Melatonin receptor type 1C [Holothuria leucospilota]|uniref:Melatonin receptor type 1C n=1 Tax=Holothuria leucospilota TaxID=206669 RepID=A0A9Q1CM10_HOLLE|nr:Melatonin receptor type 1C [Holothuria leucospilota]
MARVNISDSSDCVDVQSEFNPIVFQVMIVATLAISTVGGNVCTLLTFIGSRYLRNSHGLIIVSLAFSDFGIGLVSMGSIYPAALQYWPHKHIFCVLQGFLFEVCHTNSFFMTVFLSIERYLAVIHPHQYTTVLARKKVSVIICVTWIVAFVGYGLPTALQRFQYLFNKPILVCLVKYRQFNNLSVGAVFLWFLFTFVNFGLVTYTCARVTLAMRNIAEKRLGQASQRQVQQKSRFAKKALHTFKISIVILVAFYVLRSPYVAIILATALKVDKCSLPNFLIFVAYWVAMINGCFNFFVYVVMNLNFRREFKRLVMRQEILPPRETKTPTATNEKSDSNRQSPATIQPSSSNSSQRQ